MSSGKDKNRAIDAPTLHADQFTFRPIPIPPAIIADMAKPETKPHPPCPWCGGAEFVSGKIGGSFGMSGFIPDGGGLAGKFFGIREPVSAIKCAACGYLLQFSKPGSAG
jgi:hypothetical protein